MAKFNNKRNTALSASIASLKPTKKKAATPKKTVKKEVLPKPNTVNISGSQVYSLNDT